MILPVTGSLPVLPGREALCCRVQPAICLQRWDAAPGPSASDGVVLTLCRPVVCSTPGFPVLHHLPEFAQTRVH